MLQLCGSQRSLFVDYVDSHAENEEVSSMSGMAKRPVRMFSDRLATPTLVPPAGRHRRAVRGW